MSGELRRQTIIFEGRGPGGLPTLDRPERLSAIHRQMIDELDVCFDGAERDADIRGGLKAALAWRDDRSGS